MTTEKKQEYTRRISQANRTKIITVVYEMTMTYLEDAKAAYTAGDGEAADSALEHARRCLDDLLGALDMQYELSRNLQQMYLFCKKKLSLAQARRDTALIDETHQIILKLHEAWVQLEALDESQGGFDNAQTVYAGLTYGRGTLNETVSDQGANRGFRG